MKLDLKKFINSAPKVAQCISLQERLPAFVAGSFEMEFSYEVIDNGEFYLLKIVENALVPMHCQRCMGEFIQQPSQDFPQCVIPAWPVQIGHRIAGE